MIGRTLAHYTVVEIIGEGAMGTVYRARDTKLGRDVALKVLPEDLASDSDRLERFQREARALASIDHPNIVTVYSVEEDAGVHFLTMALVTGQSLKAKLDKLNGEPVSLPVFYDAASQLIDALSAAHEKGIVHRDLKPANAMQTDDGRIKILDFGLAKVTEVDSEGETDLRTRKGIVMGTAPYMSPEQAQGQPVDHRSDIFSLGVMFYEMLAGKRPFRGDNSAALFSSILRDQPAPITGPPHELSRLVLRCLSKNPRERFQTAREVQEELSRLSRETAISAVHHQDAPAVKTVVVLPFANRSADPENEYFSDGLTEEVISDLSRIAALRVISRNSAMALKGTNKDTPTLARELDVSHLVTGSVRRAGDALRVTAELVETKTDRPIWSEKYSGTVEDVFGIQEEISRKIVSALEVKLTDTEERQVAERPIDNAVAYDGYLRARQEMYGWTAESSRRALRLVDDALAIVGDNPLLLATKGQIHWMNANVMLEPFDESLDRAAEYAERALALDPDSPLGIFVRGLVAGLRGHVERALEDVRRARELRPGDANVLAELCRFSYAAGLRKPDALVDELVRIDPLTPVTSMVLANHSVLYGRFQEAVPAARRAIEMAPGASLLHILSAWNLAEAGLQEEASEILGRVGVALEGSVNGSYALFLKNALEGNAEVALSHATPEMERAIRTDHFTRTVADGYALIGRRTDAVRWIRIAMDCGFINYPFLAQHAPFLSSVRTDPGFQELMDELKVRWEAVVEWERRSG